MYCKYCGKQVSDGARFCKNCGARLGYSEDSAEAGGESLQSAQIEYEIVNGGVYSPTIRAECESAPTVAADEPPMKWHKFLSYFALWAAALLNFINGASLLNGTQYGGNAEAAYLQAPSLKALDTVCGVALIAAAALNFFTAYSLLMRKKAAPKLVLAVYGVSIALRLGYAIPAAIIISNAVRVANVSELIISGVTNALYSAIMLIANMIYYKKREHLFIN